MSKCIDCLHYNICTFGKRDIINAFGVCPFYTDRSEWVHLPCKVGDTIYKLWYEPCHLGETYPDSYDCAGCYDECDIKKVITEYKVPSLRFIIEELMDDSCVYYITREEAEKALEGMKSE